MTADTDFAIVPFVSIVPIVSKLAMSNDTYNDVIPRGYKLKLCNAEKVST